MGSVTLLLLGFAAAAFIVWIADFRAREREQLRIIRPARIGALPRGVVEVSGRVSVHARVLRSPSHGETCVAYRCSVAARPARTTNGWIHVADLADDVPFIVADGTGALIVDSREITLPLRVQGAEIKEQLPPLLRRALDPATLAAHGANATEYRVAEELLRLNDELHLVLRVHVPGSASSARYDVLRISCDPLLIASTEDRTMVFAGAFIVWAALMAIAIIIFL